MTLTCSGKLEDLSGIYVDGKLVDPSNYTLKSGSTILTLKASYFAMLLIRSLPFFLADFYGKKSHAWYNGFVEKEKLKSQTVALKGKGT